MREGTDSEGICESTERFYVHTNHHTKTCRFAMLAKSSVLGIAAHPI